jgi:hypothetical protein
LRHVFLLLSCINRADHPAKMSYQLSIKFHNSMKNGVFWDVTPCCIRQLLVTASVVTSSPIFVTLMKEALISSEMSFLQEPYGVTTQKTSFFIVTTVKTTNLTIHNSRLMLMGIGQRVQCKKRLSMLLSKDFITNILLCVNQSLKS